MKRVLPTFLLATLLSGCVAEIPDYASVDTHGDIEGATLYGWLEPGEHAVQIHGLFDNDSGRALLTYNGYHLGAWNITILNETGDAQVFNPRLSCRDYDYKHLADRDRDDLTFTWDKRVFDDLDVCKNGQEPPSRDAPPGEYTVVLQFLLARQPDHAFEVRLPVFIE